MSDAAADQTTGPPEQEEASARWSLLGFGFAVLWLFVRGVEIVEDGAILFWHPLGEFVIGLAIGLPTAYVFREFYSPTPVVSRSLAMVTAAVTYLVVFTWELLTANVDVARRVLSPSMPIEPAVIEVPLRVETDLAITTIANSITLTPGTLTMDYDDDRNALYVHAIAGSDPEAVVEPIRTWEDLALVIFEERHEPGSPAPDPDAGRERPPAAEATAEGGDGDE